MFRSKTARKTNPETERSRLTLGNRWQKGLSRQLRQKMSEDDIKYTQWEDTLFLVSIPLGTFYFQ